MIVGREARIGVPEVVYAPGKSAPQLSRQLAGSWQARGRVIVSRVTDSDVAHLRTHLPDAQIAVGEGMRTARVTTADYREHSSGGRVGVLTAGTSDLPAADEAAVMARAMGCEVRIVADVGVAGLHRLFAPLEDCLTGAAMR